MGALGNETAKNLALAGVGELHLLDFDRVELTNLNRTVLFSPKDVGSLKVVAACKSLLRINPECRIKGYNSSLNDFLKRHQKVLRSVDVIVGGLDNDEARIILNHMSVKYRIPYVDGGMFNTLCSVRVSIPPYTPCWECGLPKSIYATIGERYRCEEVVFEDLTSRQMIIRHPTVSTVTSTTAGIQSHEVLKILLGLESFRARGVWTQGVGKPIENEIQYDCRTNSFLAQTFPRDPECYVCGTRIQGALDPVEPIAIQLDKKARINELKSKIGDKLNSSFNLVRGLRPFPERSKAIPQIRSVFQKLDFLSRTLSRSNQSSGRESYRILQKSLQSDLMRCAEQTLHEGIPFSPQVLMDSMRSTKDTVQAIASEGDSNSLSLSAEIQHSIEGILHLLQDEMTVEECGIRSNDVLCAIHGRRMSDTAVDIM
jgi:adenylyltransferase/sulfurtransferase